MVGLIIQPFLYICILIFQIFFLPLQNKTTIMTKEQIKIGTKVWYYPILGGKVQKEAVVTDGPFEMCGTDCCFINIVRGCVAVENLEPRHGN